MMRAQGNYGGHMRNGTEGFGSSRPNHTDDAAASRFRGEDSIPATFFTSKEGSSSEPTDEPPAPDRGGTGPRRRWPMVVAVAVALAAVGSTGYLAWANYQTGEQWRERAAAAETDVDRLVAANDQLETDLDDTRAALVRSETDVAEFEERVAGLANEKARVEDEREHVEAQAERIVEIAIAYDDVASQFQRCVDETNEFTSMMVDADYYYQTGQWYLVSLQASDADRACDAAQSELWTLRSYVDALASG
jgi:hypothetical protein